MGILGQSGLSDERDRQAIIAFIGSQNVTLFYKHSKSIKPSLMEAKGTHISI